MKMVLLPGCHAGEDMAMLNTPVLNVLDSYLLNGGVSFRIQGSSEWQKSKIK